MRILIVGAGPFQCELIAQAKLRGEVFVISNNATDVGVELADHFRAISILDKESCLKFIQENNIEYVLSAGSQLAAFTASWLNDVLGFNGFNHSFVKTMTDKFLMRTWLVKNGFSSLCFTKEKRALTDHVLWLVKPRIASGSRGIEQFSKQTDLTSIANQSYITKGWMAEEKLEGKSCTAVFVIENGKPKLLFTTEKIVNAFFVPVAHFLTEIKEEQNVFLEKIVNQMIQEFALQSGFIDLDFILAPNQIEVVDVGTRLSGNGLVDLYTHGTGVNLYEQQVKMALGEKLSSFETLTQVGLGVALYFGEKEGTLQAYRSTFEGLQILAEKHFVAQGNQVKQLTEGKNQLGFFIFEAENKTAIHNAVQNGTVFLE